MIDSVRLERDETRLSINNNILTLKSKHNFRNNIKQLTILIHINNTYMTIFTTSFQFPFDSIIVRVNDIK